MKYSQYLKPGTSLFTVLICSMCVVFLQKANLKQQEETKNQLTYAQEEKKLASIAEIQQRLPGFGYDNLLADWNFLQFVQYFGDAEAREVTGYSLVTDYFKVVVDKDPRFTQALLSFSAANSLFAGKPKETVELINKALKTASPDLPGYPFLLWTYKATDEILFLGNISAAKDSYKMAAKWASMKNDDVGKKMTTRYKATAKFLASNPDTKDAQIVAWTNVLSQAPDLKTQQRAIDKLKTLGVNVFIDGEGKINVVKQKKT